MWVVVRIRFDKMFGKKVLVPTMHVDCSQYWKMLIANVSRKVLVPTIYVGCSHFLFRIILWNNVRFSTHDIRGL